MSPLAASLALTDAERQVLLDAGLMAVRRGDPDASEARRRREEVYRWRRRHPDRWRRQNRDAQRRWRARRKGRASG